MWIDVRELSDAVGVTSRAVQLKIQKGELVARRKDGRSYEVDSDSVPPEWRPLVGKLHPAARPAAAPALSASAESALGRKLSEKEMRRLEIAHYAESLSEVPESMRVSLTAGYFGISESTVRRCIRGISGFGIISGERRPVEPRAWEPEAIAFLRSYYLQLMKERNIDSKEAAWKAVRSEAQKRNWRIGSRSSAFRMLKDIPGIITGYATGGSRALDNFFYIKRDWGSLEPAAVLIGDQHIADFWVVDDRDAENPYYFRPTFYVWEDAATRCIAGLAVDEDYSSETVLNALYMAISRFGFFGATYNDNGTSECSNAVVTVIDEIIRLSGGRSRMLDISELYKTSDGRYAVEDADGNIVDMAPDEKAWRNRHRRIYAQVKNAKAKPIERLFSTLEMKMAERGIPGHVVTPGCPADQEEKESMVLERQKRNGEILTLEEFVREMIATISEYESTRHSSLGMSPLEKVNEWIGKGWKPVYPESRADLDFIFLTRKKARVRKGRVTVDGVDFIGEDLRNENGQLLDVGLVLHEGESVEVRYSAVDMSRAYAVFPDAAAGSRIRALRAVEAIDMLDEKKLSEAISWKRRCMRTVKESFAALSSPYCFRDDGKKELTEVEKADRALEEAAEDKEGTAEPEPCPRAPRIRPVRPLFSSSFERFRWCCDMIISDFGLDENDRDFCARYRLGEEYQENEEYWEAYMKAGGAV